MSRLPIRVTVKIPCNRCEKYYPSPNYACNCNGTFYIQQDFSLSQFAKAMNQAALDESAQILTEFETFGELVKLVKRWREQAMLCNPSEADTLETCANEIEAICYPERKSQ